MQKIKIGDTVKIMAGKDKGRDGKVEKIYTNPTRVLVPGVNIYKRHIKGTGAQGGQKGGIYDLPRFLDVSKVAVICPKCKKTTRVGLKMAGGEKVRFCKKCSQELDTK